MQHINFTSKVITNVQCWSSMRSVYLHIRIDNFPQSIFVSLSRIVIHEFIIECELSLVENIFYSILIKFDHRWRRVSVAENLFSQSNNKWFLSIPNDEIEFDMWVCELYTNFNIWIWVNKLINQFWFLIGAIELQSYISQTFWSISFYEKIN